MSRDAVGRRRAFVGLLRHCVVTRFTQPELWPAVFRHRSVLTEWFSERLGYRLMITDSAARLYRIPVAGEVAAPLRTDIASRRVLVLAVLVAAAAEDTDDITSMQDLSDRVRVLSRRDDTGLAPYDPDRYAERLLFVKAVRILADAGTLRPLNAAALEAGEGWAQRKDAVGGAYEIRREDLLRMVDPACLQVALGEPAGHVFSPRYGVMRRLLELPVCLYDDLTDHERTYLTGQRRRLLSWCEEMTGWTPEERAEGIALVASDEDETDLPFPRLRAADFTTLMVLDELLREPGPGEPFDGERIELAAAEVAVRYSTALTVALREPAAMVGAAVETLGALDLLRSDGTVYHLTPVAARFRDPAVADVTARFGTDD
ncbi:DUF2398 family protein [Kribbella sp. NPDC059898]|uniref:DUF2398 family protein n=1 Tax=Kribbella sp. NPDC059898 TaxID=3346995 RepID=UPI0036609595